MSFAFLFLCFLGRLKASMFGIVIFGFIDISTLVFVSVFFLCLVLKVCYAIV
jgi:hypothetical protein